MKKKIFFSNGLNSIIIKQPVQSLGGSKYSGTITKDHPNARYFVNKPSTLDSTKLFPKQVNISSSEVNKRL